MEYGFPEHKHRGAGTSDLIPKIATERPNRRAVNTAQMAGTKEPSMSRDRQDRGEFETEEISFISENFDLNFGQD